MAFGALALLVGMFAVCDPLSWRIFPKCLFHELTGWNCPGCGASRALNHLAHGQVAAALGCNALVLVALPGLAYMAARRDLATVRPAWIWCGVGVGIAFTILRNLPGLPFSMLHP